MSDSGLFFVAGVCLICFGHTGAGIFLIVISVLVAGR